MAEFHSDKTLAGFVVMLGAILAGAVAWSWLRMEMYFWYDIPSNMGPQLFVIFAPVVATPIMAVAVGVHVVLLPFFAFRGLAIWALAGLAWSSFLLTLVWPPLFLAVVAVNPVTVAVVYRLCRLAVPGGWRGRPAPPGFFAGWRALWRTRLRPLWADFDIRRLGARFWIGEAAMAAATVLFLVGLRALAGAAAEGTPFQETDPVFWHVLATRYAPATVLGALVLHIALARYFRFGSTVQWVFAGLAWGLVALFLTFPLTWPLVAFVNPLTLVALWRAPTRRGQSGAEEGGGEAPDPNAGRDADA